MDQERLWNLSFLGLGTSNALFYMTQYMLIATLPIVILMWGGKRYRGRFSHDLVPSWDYYHAAFSGKDNEFF